MFTRSLSLTLSPQLTVYNISLKLDLSTNIVMFRAIAIGNHNLSKVKIGKTHTNHTNRSCLLGYLPWPRQITHSRYFTRMNDPLAIAPPRPVIANATRKIKRKCSLLSVEMTDRSKHQIHITLSNPIQYIINQLVSSLRFTIAAKMQKIVHLFCVLLRLLISIKLTFERSREKKKKLFESDE